jgi:curved DNA-binding protein CbpA
VRWSQRVGLSNAPTTAASLLPPSTTAAPTPAAGATVALCWARRDFTSDGAAPRQGHTVTAADLRTALHTLDLHDDCTDADVKRAFRAFAMLHHPDMNAAVFSSSGSGDSESHSTGSSTASAAGDVMRRGTEAYHLLRQTTYAVRQSILKEAVQRGGGAGAGRFQGPGSNFHFTEAEYAKAQRTYEGDRRRRRQRRQRRGEGGRGDDSDADLFDLNTPEGRRRASRFDELKSRIVEMRRRGRRDDLPPWRADEDASTKTSTAAFNAGAFGEGPSESQRPPGGGEPRNPNRLGLHFFHATVSNLTRVHDLHRRHPSFAGMDGSSYDNPRSAAQVAPELSVNPKLRQYILMRQRAQEKAIVDRAVKQPLLLFLLLVCGGVVVLVAVRVARSHDARVHHDEALRRRDEERGGA